MLKKLRLKPDLDRSWFILLFMLAANIFVFVVIAIVGCCYERFYRCSFLFSKYRQKIIDL